MSSDDILSKLIEHFIAVEVYMKEDGDGPTPLVKKQYVYPEAEDQDFFNNISLFAFPSEKTYDDSKISLRKSKNKNNVFKDSSKDHYDITEISVTKPKIKNCLDDVKCHDFILTNQYGEKVYGSCIRTRKIPLKWDINRYSEHENAISEGVSEKPMGIHHAPYESDSTVYIKNDGDTQSHGYLNSFCVFDEFGSSGHLSENNFNISEPTLVPFNTKSDNYRKVQMKKNKDDLAYLKCKNNKQFSVSYTALSKIPTVPTSSYLTSSVRHSNRNLNKQTDGDLLGHENTVVDSDNDLVSKSHFSSENKNDNKGATAPTSPIDNNKNNRHSSSSSSSSSGGGGGGGGSSSSISGNNTSNKKMSISTKNNKNLFLTMNKLKPKSYYGSDPENINYSTACILSQYTNIKQQQQQTYTNTLNNIHSSFGYIDHNLMSRSNMHINTMKSNFRYTHFYSNFNINGIPHKKQIRGCLGKYNNANDYNYTQSTSNLNSSNDQLIQSYRKCENRSQMLYPKAMASQEMGSGGRLPPLCRSNMDDFPYNGKIGSKSIVDSLNLDFISMENLASEKMLQKQQTNQSLFYNLDLCVNGSMRSSLFSIANNSVNSLFSKKTITSYILISRRPIFSIMQKCLIEMYLLSKYSLQKNKKKTGPTAKSFLKQGIMESFLAYLMHTIFLPSLNSPFTIEIKLPLSKEILQIQPQYKTQIMPLYHPVYIVFQLLSINNIISIFTHMTLEKSVIFYSENPSILTAICETFLSFLEPLEWRMVYIPVVPESVIESLQEAPITFIMGYISSNGSGSSSSMDSSSSSLNIDTNTAPSPPNSRSKSGNGASRGSDGRNGHTSSNSKGQGGMGSGGGGGGDKGNKTSNDHPTSNGNNDTINNFRMHKSEEEILYVNLDTDELFNLSEQRLRLPYESRLRDDLRQIIYQDYPSLQKEIYFDRKVEYTVKMDECVQNVRKCFYHWFVTILYNYQSFYISDGDFNISAFRSRFSDACIDYINRFTETSMFTYFIEKKYREKISLLSSSSIKPRDYFDLCSNKLLGIPYFEKTDKIDTLPELNTLKYNTLLLDPPKKDNDTMNNNSSSSSGSGKAKSQTITNSTNNNNKSSAEAAEKSKTQSNREILGLTSKESNSTLFSSSECSSLFQLYSNSNSGTSNKLNSNNNNNASKSNVVTSPNFSSSFGKTDGHDDTLYYFNVNTFEFFNTKYQNNSILPSTNENVKITQSFTLLFNNINRLIDQQILYCKSSNTNSITNITAATTTTTNNKETSRSVNQKNKEEEKEKIKDKDHRGGDHTIESTIANTYHALKEILPLASYKGGYSSSVYSTNSNLTSSESLYNSKSTKSLTKEVPSSSSTQPSRFINNTTTSTTNSNSNIKNNSNSSYGSLSSLMTYSNAALAYPYRFRLQQLLWIRGLLLQEYSLDIFQSIEDFCWAYNFCSNDTLLEMIENSFLQLSNHQKCRLFKKLNHNFFLAFDKIFSYNSDIKTMYDAYIQCTNME